MSVRWYNPRHSTAVSAGVDDVINYRYKMCLRVDFFRKGNPHMCKCVVWVEIEERVYLVWNYHFVPVINDVIHPCRHCSWMSRTKVCLPLYIPWEDYITDICFENSNKTEFILPHFLAPSFPLLTSWVPADTTVACLGSQCILRV
jgi:hypothetical protein